ncbi:MAG: hypothetical protein ACRDQX_09245 [Pseudonocardiaceae bacterium]
MRRPLVCGVAGGVGTSTIAAALHAQDGGVYHDGPADIIVCRTTSTSITLAHRVVSTVTGMPVLVVVADGPLRPPPAVRARLTMVRPHITALVAMPYIPHWREIDEALEQAKLVTRVPRDQVPKLLRPWTAALLQLGDAVLPLVEHSISDAVGQRDSNTAVMQGSGPLPPSAAGN